MNTRYTSCRDILDIAQAQQGNDDAFARLVETYQTPVFNLCYRMMGDPALAEDAAQESFLRAYQNLQRFDAQRTFLPWLLSIAAHYCIDRLRRRKFNAFSIDEDGDEEDECPRQFADPDAADPQALLEQHEEQQALHRALARLDATDRAIVILRYWHDFSDVEIAENLCLTVPAVKCRLFRARRALAGHYNRVNESPRANVGRSVTPAFA